MKNNDQLSSPYTIHIKKKSRITADTDGTHKQDRDLPKNRIVTNVNKS